MAENTLLENYALALHNRIVARLSECPNLAVKFLLDNFFLACLDGLDPDNPNPTDEETLDRCYHAAITRMTQIAERA